MWMQLIRPGTVNLILGYRGSGKSGLAYYLMELAHKQYKIAPIVVDFPPSYLQLLPDYYRTVTLEEALVCTNSAILVDECTTKLPAGTAMEEFVKACSSLSRQRHQIMFFTFHSSRDAGAKALRGIDAILLKEPSGRQIRYGSKDPWFKQLLEAAREKFAKIPEEKRCEFTYVDCEKPDFQGMLKNLLPSFWSQELSEVWGQEREIVGKGETDPESLDDIIEAVIAQSTVVEGENLVCCMCGQKCSQLISDVCRPCFVTWVSEVEKEKKEDQKLRNAR